ncbi:MAG TPA: hypothetical protein VIP51_01315 [Eoetvoesiella sp.]
MLAAGLFLAAFAGTVLWSLVDIGLDYWGLISRLLAMPQIGTQTLTESDMWGGISHDPNNDLIFVNDMHLGLWVRMMPQQAGGELSKSPKTGKQYVVISAGGGRRRPAIAGSWRLRHRLRSA